MKRVAFFIVFSFFTISIFMSCGSKRLVINKNVQKNDKNSPRIVSITPQGNTSEVPVSKNEIIIEFSEPLDETSIRDRAVIVSSGGRKIYGSIRYSHDNNSIIFTSNTEWEYSTVYKITISKQITDISGNELKSNYHSMFITENYS